MTISAAWARALPRATRNPLLNRRCFRCMGPSFPASVCPESHRHATLSSGAWVLTSCMKEVFRARILCVHTGHASALHAFWLWLLEVEIVPPAAGRSWHPDAAYGR